jgi:hypothetical protein
MEAILRRAGAYWMPICCGSHLDGRPSLPLMDCLLASSIDERILCRLGLHHFYLRNHSRGVAYLFSFGTFDALCITALYINLYVIYRSVRNRWIWCVVVP